MADALEAGPRLNPAITALFEGAAAAVKSRPAAGGGLPFWAYILAAILVYLCLSYYGKVYWTLETPANIRTRLRTFTDKFNLYGDQRSSRRSLTQYLEDLRKLGVPDTSFALTNFYVCSANTAATFTPVRDGLASPDAVRLALAAGARYLDFSIWSGGATTGHAPFIAEMDAGSKWRRLTMNEISFRAAMDAVKSYGMAGPQAAADTSMAPYAHDPLFIMLRFMGSPKPETFDKVADALNKTIEQFRLDFTYYKGRGMDRFFKTPITEFMDKVIVMTNLYPPDGSPLSDYINIGPRSFALEMSPKEILGTPATNRPTVVAKIQQNLVVTRSSMEEPQGDTNTWDFAPAQALGVHFTAMNFWSQDANLAAYRKPEMFGVNSFKIKPATMRYIIEYIRPPALPDPSLNARDGRPNAPPGIIMPI
uniref:Uncharacterized protein n=1 Tax=viral metagenome TaxID=1070528 RepID=A0A6C0DS09_9ZZZZ